MKKFVFVLLLCLPLFGLAQFVDESIRTINIEDSHLNFVTYSKDGRYIASAFGKNVKIWNAESGECIKIFKAISFVKALAFSPNGEFIITGGGGLEGGDIQLWDINTNQCIRNFVGHKNVIQLLEYSPDGNIIVSASDDKTIRIWDTSSGKCVKKLAGYKHETKDIQFSNDSKLIVSSGIDNNFSTVGCNIKIWDSKSGACIKTFDEAYGSQVVFSSDGSYVLSSAGRYVNLLDISTNQEIKKIGDTTTIYPIALSFDGKQIITGSLDGIIKFWDTSSGSFIKALYGHKNPIRSLYVSPNKKNLVSYANTEIKIWDLTGTYTLADALANNIKKYVEPKIKIWQIKDEFEKTVDFQTRVNETTRKVKINELTQLFIDSLKMNVAKTVADLKFDISIYDPDNETYLIENVTWGKFPLPVSNSNAAAVKSNWSTAQFINPDFYLDNGKFRLSKFSIIVNRSTYTYDSKIPTTYSNSSITYNFAPIDISVPQDKPVGANQQINTGGTVTIGSADVDTNIPASTIVNDKTFVVIIANENYQRESKVDFAANDGKVFKSYCEKTLGIPSANIHYVENATYGNLLAEKDWLSKVLEAGNGSVKGIFYYAGHGIPNEQTKSAYLLPVDGNSTSTATALSLDDLYNSFGQYPSKGVTVFLDACFSGSTRDNGALASARSGKLKPRESTLTGNLVVFSAATGDETAWPYRDKQHGLFTYYLLKKLQETKGDVTYKDLIDYLTDKVKFESVTKNSKSQTPTINYSPSANPVWEGWKLK